MSATATRKRAKERRREYAATLHIRESSDSASLRVDRELGVIFGVKILGKESPNRHGKAGVKGTDYTHGAHVSLVPLLEGLRVNKNHTERSNPNRDRTVGERIGWLEKPRVENGETFADFYVLKSDPDAAKIFESAERNPRCFAMSINADGKYEVKNNRLVIELFERAYSVDVVADGGSTISLAESDRSKKGRQNMPLTLREALQSIKLPAKLITRLFEGDDTLLKPDMAADVMPPPADESEEEGYKAHLGRAIMAVLEDAEIDDAEKLKKITAIAKLAIDEEEKPAEGETPTTESDDDADGGKDGEEKKDGDKKVKESLERLEKLERRDNVRTLCESRQFIPSKTHLAALVGLDTDAERVELIDSLKGIAGTSSGDGKGTGGKGKGTGLPRSSGGGTVRTQESKMPATAEEQAKLLLRS